MDFPIKNGVDFPSKSPFSHGFPIIFPLKMVDLSISLCQRLPGRVSSIRASYTNAESESWDQMGNGDPKEIHEKSPFSMGKSSKNHHFQWVNPRKITIFEG